ncbi:hypothetical protein HMN09_00664000 [Mycena chlorophos]|uniref:DUF1348-domain-containing protein n=1 Tax=Mycena chlorophos TaxID=658473 RepID=A0A8H6W7Z0_MYCCL|nr:hypothetical protein HMN09_00664000 [Mycena chlorophos]
MSAYPAFAMGGLCIVGGAAGFVRTRSVPSLVAGLGYVFRVLFPPLPFRLRLPSLVSLSLLTVRRNSVGAAYLWAGERIRQHQQNGIEAAIGASAVLFVSSAPRMLKRPVPALLTASSLASGAYYGRTAYALGRHHKENPQPAKSGPGSRTSLLSQTVMSSPIVPPFTAESARIKVKTAQTLWNTRDPAKVALAYTPDTIWRNRTTFLQGREEVERFLTDKWAKEHFYVLRKELFTFSDNKIAVQFFYEWNERADGTGQWYRTYGLEDWTFDASGLMRKRQMSGNDLAISHEERWFKEGVDIESVDITEKHL